MASSSGALLLIVLCYIIELFLQPVIGFRTQVTYALDANGTRNTLTSANGTFKIDTLVGMSLLTQFIEGITHREPAVVSLDIVDGFLGTVTQQSAVLLLFLVVVGSIHIVVFFVYNVDCVDDVYISTYLMIIIMFARSVFGLLNELQNIPLHVIIDGSISLK